MHKIIVLKKRKLKAKRKKYLIMFIGLSVSREIPKLSEVAKMLDQMDNDTEDCSSYMSYIDPSATVASASTYLFSTGENLNSW